MYSARLAFHQAIVGTCILRTYQRAHIHTYHIQYARAKTIPLTIGAIGRAVGGAAVGVKEATGEGGPVVEGTAAVVVVLVELRPGPRHGPGAVGLEEELVLPALDSKPAALAPVLAPGVADEPVPDGGVVVTVVTVETGGVKVDGAARGTQVQKIYRSILGRLSSDEGWVGFVSVPNIEPLSIRARCQTGLRIKS